MTAKEMRYEFDLLYNNIMSNMAPGLDDYEVSLFLTQAQEQIVSQLYEGSNLKFGFESSESNRRILASLICSYSQNVSDPQVLGKFLQYFVSLPSDLWVLIEEHVNMADTDCCKGSNKNVVIVPVKYDEVNRILLNPFRCPNSKRVLRLDANNLEITIISHYIINTYYCTYLKKPHPIIISDLPEGFSIDGYIYAQDCLLNDAIHRLIIKYAVQLAKLSWEQK